MNKIPFFRFFLSLFFILSAFAAGGFLYLVHHKPIDFSVLERYDVGEPTIVLDDEGVEWTRFQLEKREPVSLGQLPAHLIQAFISAEDWAFFKHHGISWRGIIRSLFINLYHGRYVQGASTITQQLVKLLFFDSNKTITRKIKEQFFSILVENQYTKEQILQTYLNHVYFGCGVYGVQAAAQKFWGVDAACLTVAQSAVLAGVVCSPAQYCPLICPLSSQRRRDMIIQRMHRLGYIDAATRDQSCQQELNLRARDTAVALAPHLKETLRLFLEELVGREQVYRGGLAVKTTLNQDAQRCAQTVFRDHLTKLKSSVLSDIDGSLISIDVKTGGIKAIIGGYDFSVSQYNRALQARRQIGSVFKPFVYAAAIEKGKSFADIDSDEPLELAQPDGQIWSPKNFNLQFDGPVTLAYALYRSVNTIAVKTFLFAGHQRVIELAKACGLPGPFNPYPSLALGCTNGTLKEVAGMFNVLANNGQYVEPHFISWVKDRWGTKMYRARPAHANVLFPRVNAQVAKVLTLALKMVRRYYPQPWVETEAISKTGTTNDCRTCWYVGATPQVTTAIYIGCDDNRSMGKNVLPLRTAFPIWMGFNRRYQLAQKKKKGLFPPEYKKFLSDPSLTSVVINEQTGRSTSINDPSAIEIFV